MVMVRAGHHSLTRDNTPTPAETLSLIFSPSTPRAKKLKAVASATARTAVLCASQCREHKTHQTLAQSTFSNPVFSKRYREGGWKIGISMISFSQKIPNLFSFSLSSRQEVLPIFARAFQNVSASKFSEVFSGTLFSGKHMYKTDKTDL